MLLFLDALPFRLSILSLGLDRYRYRVSACSLSHCKKYTPAVLPTAASTPQFMTLTTLCFETYVSYAQCM